jgi:hypothetical protein
MQLKWSSATNQGRLGRVPLLEWCVFTRNVVIKSEVFTSNVVVRFTDFVCNVNCWEIGGEETQEEGTNRFIVAPSNARNRFIVIPTNVRNRFTMVTSLVRKVTNPRL